MIKSLGFPLSCLALTIAALSPAHANELNGSVRATTSYATVSNGYPDSKIQSVSVSLTPRAGTRVGLSTAYIDAWGDTAAFAAVSVAQDLSDTLSVQGNLGASDKSRITVQHRAGMMVTYKALAAKNLLLGVGADYYTMRSGGASTSLVTQAVYYAPFAPLVVQGTFSLSRSSINGHQGDTFGLAATYGRVGGWTATVTTRSGRVHYELLSQPGTVADYRSYSYGASVDYWLAPDYGFTVGLNKVYNDYFERNAITAGMFFNF